jgi:hypothetical protein|tara:strand:- start:4796 stop:5485 length:690 start_codon:yes stop_codon:yes gene_type:complete
MIGASRARVLYTAGYRTPEAILTMSLKQLALLFEGSKGAAGQGEGQMRAAHTVMRGARRVCEDARRAAREESEAKLRKLQALAPIIETRTSLGDGISFGVGDDEEVLEGATPVRNKKRKVDVVPPAEVFDPKTATGAVVVRRPKDIAALEVRIGAFPNPGTVEARLRVTVYSGHVTKDVNHFLSFISLGFLARLVRVHVRASSGDKRGVVWSRHFRRLAARRHRPGVSK